MKLKFILSTALLIVSSHSMAASKDADFPAKCAALLSSSAQLKTLYQWVNDWEAEQEIYVGGGMIMLSAFKSSESHAFEVYENKRKSTSLEAAKYVDENGDRSKLASYLLHKLAPEIDKCSVLTDEFNVDTSFSAYVNSDEGKRVVARYNESIK